MSTVPHKDKDNYECVCVMNMCKDMTQTGHILRAPDKMEILRLILR